MSFSKNFIRTLILFVALFAYQASYAQDTLEVVEIEYFFDLDPGFGNGTLVPVGPDTTVNLVQTLNASGLQTGFHTLGLRARNRATNPKFNVLDTGSLIIAPYEYINPVLRAAGDWGMTETRLVFVDASDGAGTIVNVDQIEYFFDADPGVGSATLINSFAANPNISIVETLASNALPTGFHVLGMRARAVGGSWGTTETRLVFVDQSDGAAIVNVDSLEYFFDVDPGVGNGTIIDGFAVSNNVSLLETLNASSLSLGFHSLGMRAKAEGGAWGLTETRLMFIDPSASGGIINVDEIEYFFNDDPGVGAATSITSFSANSSISLVENLPSSGLATGFHVLGMRARAVGGSWGTTETRMVFVDQAGNLRDITAMEYFIDVDPGAGAATPIVVASPADSISITETLNTSGLATGSYTVNVRAQNQHGDWGLVESRPLVVVDVGPPIITSAQTSPTNIGTLDMTITFEEAINSFVEADIDVSPGGSIQASSFTTVNDSTFTFLLDLSNEGLITVDIADSAAFTQDNNSPTPASEQFVVFYDNTVPVVTVDILSTPDTSPQLTGTVDDDSTSVSITVDGSTYGASTVSGGVWTLNAGIISPPLADGFYDVMVSATDSAGNVGVDGTTNELEVSVGALVAQAASSITSTSFDANWSGGTDVQNYELDVSTTSDFSSLVPGFDPFITPATFTSVSGLDFSTQYYYRVRVRDNSDQLSGNSNTISTKTTVDANTLADSTALVQIFNALNGPNWTPAVNWETARLRDWDGIFLTGTKTRVSQVNIDSRGAQGSMPNPFTGGAVGGLSVLNTMDLSNNQVAGLMDFGATTVSILNVSNNSLEFDDLEPLLGIPTLTYAGQSSIFFVEYNAGDTIERAHLSSPVLSISTGGTANTYTFSRNGTAISQGADFNITGPALEIVEIDFDNMGEFTAAVTNSLLPDLTLSVEAQEVLAVADLSMLITDSNGDPVASTISGYLLEAFRRQQGFDTLEIAEDVGSSFVFPHVVLGNYLCGINPSDLDTYIPTYFGDDFEWVRADTVFFREASSVQVRLTEVPGPLNGEGSLDVVIEEDFPEDGSRIDARRRAAKRKCGLRRKRSGGRTDQDDDFELIAYGETDENGEFKFGFLPQGTYRFFVEYPGIPLDESAEVEFEVGEAGVSDTDFKLEAFATEDGIEINIERVLGLIFTYFKDLQVFPNPSSDVVKVRYRHLKSENVQAQIVDIKGNVLTGFELRNGFDGYHEIDISGFTEGIYLLHIYDSKDRNGTVVSYRLVVKN